LVETLQVQLSPGVLRRIRQEKANSKYTFEEMIERLIIEALKARGDGHTD
jgi:hypothetical protein